MEEVSVPLSAQIGVDEQVSKITLIRAVLAWKVCSVAQVLASGLVDFKRIDHEPGNGTGALLTSESAVGTVRYHGLSSGSDH